MPEINIKVKIIGGKRTPTEVYAEPMAVNSKTLTFENGAKIPDIDFAEIINNAVASWIDNCTPKEII